jgi:prevent-host-death family protein
MRTVGLSEARRKLAELVERASQGERIGITIRGKLAAWIVAARPERTLAEAFADIEKIRKRVRLPKGLKIKDLIEEGRT